MQCKKCGCLIKETDKYCPNCGEKVVETNNQNLNPQTNNNQNDTNQVYLQKRRNENKIIILIIAIVFGCIAVFITLFIIAFSLLTANSEKLICKSDKGNITIMYRNNEIVGYKAFNMSYDLDKQKEYAKLVGIDAYIKEFNTWFSNTTSGSCTINGNKVGKNNTTYNETKNEEKTNNVTVGDEKYGYINIPSNWTKFYDIDGSSSLQYSLANVYIVTLDIVDGQSTAKEYASNFMYNKQNSNEVTDVTGATVTIGKNRKYTAYQVYMYYPSDSTYLVTYWFEAEDGKVHYISLEGPSELSGVKLTDYTYIPESFSLINNNI